MDVMGKLAKLPIEDAILILREEHQQRTDGYATYLAHGGKGDPAEEASLDALAMAISALEKTKWISVKDRLPKDQEEVLVCTRSKNGIRNIDKGYMAIDRFIHRGCAEVTHWMPLPEPPKGE